jgi:hypothetical protein
MVVVDIGAKGIGVSSESWEQIYGKGRGPVWDDVKSTVGTAATCVSYCWSISYGKQHEVAVVSPHPRQLLAARPLSSKIVFADFRDEFAIAWRERDRFNPCPSPVLTAQRMIV